MNYKIPYRPEIDGLRALAVISVIVYHAKNNLLPGGFLGVDIFFVISGYLITSLIIKELKISGNFSFSKFYIRRMRRILPAMLFTIILSIVTGYIYLTPSAFIETIKSSIAAIFFSSNIYFYLIEQDYWSNIALTKPLLNLWSLSLEEQYYLLLPIALVIFFKKLKNYILIFFILVFLISFFYVFFNSIKISSSSFYLLHARIWEFIPGSLLALYGDKFKFIKNIIFRNFLAVIGFLLILFCLFLFNSISMKIIFYNLIIVLGTSLIILFLKKDILIYQLFTNRLVVCIGLISYSLYLIHYPLFAFYRINFAVGQIYQELVLIIILFIISIFCYFFIEKKFRNYSKISNKNFLLYLIVTVISINLMSVYLIKQENVNQVKIENISIDNNYYSKEYQKYLDKLKINQIFLKNDSKKILIIGDSQASNLYMSLIINKDLYKEYDFYFINNPEGYFVNNVEGASALYCVQIFLESKINECFLRSQELKIINNFDIILISKSWRKDDLPLLSKLINHLKEKKKIILFTENVQFKVTDNKYTSLDKFLLRKKRIPNDNELRKIELQNYIYHKQDKNFKYWNDKLSIIANKNNIGFVNKSNFQCIVKDQKCHVLSNRNEKLIFDRSHYTINGASFFGKKMKELKIIKKNIN